MGQQLLAVQQEEEEKTRNRSGSIGVAHIATDTRGRGQVCYSLHGHIWEIRAVLHIEFLFLSSCSGRDDDDCSDEDEDGGGDVGEGAVSVADEERQPESPAVVVVSVSAFTPSVDLSQIHLCHHVTQHISHVDPRRTLHPLSL